MARTMERARGVSSSAFVWPLVSLLCLSAALFMTFVVVNIATPQGYDGNDGLAAFGLIGGAITLLATLSMFPVVRGQIEAESRAGYTTLRRAHPQLPQLDPRTRMVIAEPEERPLPRTEMRRRLRAVRVGVRGE
jgi:hypothetical protein